MKIIMVIVNEAVVGAEIDRMNPEIRPISYTP